MEKPEHQVCLAISRYLKTQYKGVIFRFDQAGYNLSMAQSAANKAIQMNDFKYPDLFITHNNSQYHGLFIEVKEPNCKVFKQDGTMYANEHRIAQNEALKALRAKGYYATFGIGFDDCKKTIDWYMSLI